MRAHCLTVASHKNNHTEKFTHYFNISFIYSLLSFSICFNSRFPLSFGPSMNCMHVFIKSLWLYFGFWINTIVAIIFIVVLMWKKISQVPSIPINFRSIILEFILKYWTWLWIRLKSIKRMKCWLGILQRLRSVIFE